MSLSRKLRLWLWVVLTVILAGGLVAVEVSLVQKTLVWPSPDPVPVGLVPAGSAWPGGIDRLSLQAPPQSGAWVIRIELADQGLSPAPDIRLTAGHFTASPARLYRRRLSGGPAPEPSTWNGLRTGSLRVIVPAEAGTPRSGPVSIRIVNQDPGWIVLRRIQVYPLWWQGSGLLLRLILGIYMGLSVLLLWPLGRPGGVAALQAASWLSAAGVAISIWRWGRRLIILDVAWGPESLGVCLLIWGVGQALSVGQLGTFWGAGPAWAVGRLAALFKRGKTVS
jgi:hypothetical protein